MHWRSRSLYFVLAESHNPIWKSRYFHTSKCERRTKIGEIPAKYLCQNCRWRVFQSVSGKYRISILRLILTACIIVKLLQQCIVILIINLYFYYLLVNKSANKLQRRRIPEPGVFVIQSKFDLVLTSQGDSHKARRWRNSQKRRKVRKYWIRESGKFWERMKKQ